MLLRASISRFGKSSLEKYVWLDERKTKRETVIGWNQVRRHLTSIEQLSFDILPRKFRMQQLPTICLVSQHKC